MTKKFTELTDSQWAAISPFFNLKRKRRHDLRTVMNALLYMVRAGCQWRNLPQNFPPWRAVNYYFEQWKVDGNEAVKEFTKNKIDIIFMDIQMPELDGYDATMLIRKMETGKRVPIIALTAGILKGEQTKCLEIGMDDYIPKPVVKNSIKKVLHNWLFKNDLKENSKLENEVEVIKKQKTK